jgi:iron complex outermembrane receptor protein
MTPAPNDPNEMTHALTTQVDGVKVENLLDLTDDTELSVGIDGSVRNWEGHYIRNGVTHMHPTSIDDVDTKNVALFAEVKQKMDKTETKVGLRYDRTSVETANTLSSMYAYTPQQSNDYNSLGAYIFSKYDTTKSTSVFGGIGAASRVPDARELYFVNTGGAMQGNDTLKQTKNYQADLGFENKTEDYSLKTSVFYSVLKDYIYYNDDLATNNFVNLDATRYGLEIEGEYFTTDDTSLEFKAAYQRAQKDEALAGQTDRDLAETPPLKVTTSFIWEYAQKSKASATLIAADRWKHYDSDNGEQAISGYGIVNLKANYLFSKYLDLTVGVNNVGDATYAKTNTYSDMKLITLPGTDVILMNEPGRYYYVNAKIKF